MLWEGVLEVVGPFDINLLTQFSLHSIIQNNADWPKTPNWFWGPILDCTGWDLDPERTTKKLMTVFVLFIQFQLLSDDFNFWYNYKLMLILKHLFFLFWSYSYLKQTNNSYPPRPVFKCRTIPDKGCIIRFVIFTVNPIFLFEEKFQIILLMFIALSLVY